MSRHLDIIFINLTALVIGLVVYYFADKEVEVLTAIIATGISISIGIRQYNIENDKMTKELFTEFNHKYDKKFNEELSKIADKHKNGTKKDLTDKQIQLVVDYLNLCAEEYLWFKKRRISKRIWDSWREGMKYYFNIKPIREIIEEEFKESESYYGLNEIKNELLSKDL